MACRTTSFTALRLPGGAWSGSDPLRQLFSTGGFPTDYHIRHFFSLYHWLATGGCPADPSNAAILPTSHSGCPAKFKCCGCTANFSCSLTINASCGFATDFSCVGDFDMHQIFDQTQIDISE